MIEVSLPLANARLQAVADFLALGAPQPPLVSIYEGVRPAFGGAPAGALLVAVALPAPVGTVSGGVLTLTASAEAQVTTTGTAAWARVTNGAGALAWDCDVSDLAGAGEIRLASIALYAGGFTRVVSGTLA